MKKIYSSVTLPLEKKQAILSDLEKEDSSDWIRETKLHCEAAHPANKDKMWAVYFDPEGPTKDWGLHDYQHSMLGFNQVNHYEFIKKFEEEFFEKISGIVSSKGRFVAELYFYCLCQSNRYDDAYLGTIQKLLDNVLENDKDNLFYVNFLKDKLFDLKIKKLGCEASKKYIDAQKK